MKRSNGVDKEHLLRKIRKLEKKIRKLPVSDEEDDEVDQDLLLSPERLDHENEMFPLESPTEQIELINEKSDDDPMLDESILEILGEVQTEQKGAMLHKEIANRWIEIITNGLKKEEKEEIRKNNLPFENCKELIAPKLNPEVKAALPESSKKRDQIIENRQRLISTALSCLGSALQGCINSTDHKEILKKISQASRLLCETFYYDSKGRRSLILGCINKDMKESLLQTKPQEYLFGNDLSEQIKTAKNVQKSVQDLKVPQKKNNMGNRNAENAGKNNNTRALNWRGPRQGAYPRAQKPVAAGGATHSGRGQKKNERQQERLPYRNARR